MRLMAFAAAFTAALFIAPLAQAEVAAASPSAFLIQAEAETSATPAQAWRALGQLSRWWNSDHTYSGDSARMSVDLRAGGCWCERWDGQSVEHGRVVVIMAHEGVRTLRFNSALGPLQELGVSGVLTFTIEPHASGAKIKMSYRVAGDAGLGLDQIAPVVDTVLMEQFGRLIRFSTSGSAN
ncbi:MAG TPA: ATPase [Verrucomicrobiae bacterium]|nr:ATPase [Verrucomicrobiae bacterium]